MEQSAGQVEAHIRAFYDNNPFIRLLQMHLKELREGYAEIVMPVGKATHANVYRVAHGGSLMSLADTAMGASCMTLGRKVITLDLNVNFIKAAPQGEPVFAVGRVVHSGRKTMVTECDITSKTGVLYAKARATFFVLEENAF